VKRSSNDIAEMAYYRKRECESEEFQDPYTGGDREGLSVEYYTDVTHWAEMQSPFKPSMSLKE